MRHAVARDHEPCSAAADVLPQLAMGTSGIVAQVNIIDPTLPRRFVEGLVRVGQTWRDKPILSAEQIEDIVAYLAKLRD